MTIGGGAVPGCEDAADANDDGELGITDTIYSLAHLFQGKLPPPAPGPTVRRRPDGRAAGSRGRGGADVLRTTRADGETLLCHSGLRLTEGKRPGSALRARISMTKTGKRFTLLTIWSGILVVVFASFAGRDLLFEQYWLWRLNSEDEDQTTSRETARFGDVSPGATGVEIRRHAAPRRGAANPPPGV